MAYLQANPWVWSFLGLVGLAAGLLLGARLARWGRVRRLARRMHRGQAGERHAGRWLVAHGFEILAAGAEREAGLWVSGRWRTFRVRADYLVRRRGRLGLVEVKTGARAPDPGERSTRRQLREYGQIFGVDQLFLFDADRDRLMRIRFPRPLRTGWLLAFAVGLSAGLLASLLMGPDGCL